MLIAYTEEEKTKGGKNAILNGNSRLACHCSLPNLRGSRHWPWSRDAAGRIFAASIRKKTRNHPPYLNPSGRRAKNCLTTLFYLYSKNCFVSFRQLISSNRKAFSRCSGVADLLSIHSFSLGPPLITSKASLSTTYS